VLDSEDTKRNDRRVLVVAAGVREDETILDRWCQLLPRATSMIFSLTSGVRRCHDATSSRRAQSVQTVCRQGEGVLTQVLCGVVTCETADAGAIPAASTLVFISP